MKANLIELAVAATLAIGGLLLVPTNAAAHCDTLDGPVVADAKAALEAGDVAPVLRWVKRDDEDEIRSAFERALVVRAKGPEARELADRYFFETLVRVHRAGEGAPYTGLKPAGTDVGVAVAGADKALQTGQVEGLVKLVTDQVAAGIRERFAEALERREHKDHSVDAGRAFVAAYVEFVHYVERFYHDAAISAGHHETEQPAVEEHGH